MNAKIILLVAFSQCAVAAEIDERWAAGLVSASPASPAVAAAAAAAGAAADNVAARLRNLPLPPSAEPRLLAPADGGASGPLEPYAPLSGGAFSGPAIAFHADPLARYVWAAGVNASALQIISLLPASADATPGSAPGAFANLSSLLQPRPLVTVSGAGGVQLDYGLELAAWIEFESPDLAPADLAAVTLGVSEYSEYEITNLGDKVGVPVAHAGAGAGGATMYRLELPHPDLYEGVRFAWLRVNATPSAPWHVTALRLVAQVKPTSWAGAFAAPGDDALSRIWYLGAYTVKANLLSDQIGSILIYRGDRYSWTGDAHVSQATAMAALGIFDFVLTNLQFTRENCNGIESYCLYYVLSVADYFAATGDAAAMASLAPHVDDKLEHAHDVWGTQLKLGFYSWDDRALAAYNNSIYEAQFAYRSLAIRAWTSYAGVLAALGNSSGAAHYAGYAEAATNATRATNGGDWSAGLGVIAAADAINAGVPTAAERAELVSRLFNDSTYVCALSAFNTFYFLEAMALAGELDRAHAIIHHCYDVMLLNGASTTYETAKPEWVNFLAPNEGVPGFEDGFTSLAHPWSSGATPWSTKHLLGVRAAAPGFARFEVAPHAAGAMRGVEGLAPLPRGRAVRVRAANAGAGAAHVCARAPGPDAAGVRGELRVSALLAARLMRVAPAAVAEAAARGALRAALAAGAADDESGSAACAWEIASAGAGAGAGVAGGAPLAFEDDGSGPVVDGATGLRSPVARFGLAPGACTCVRLSIAPGSEALAASAPAEPPFVAAPNPFPPPAWPAALVARDEVTQGSWPGVYGAAGYFLVAFDGPGKHRASLPPWCSSVAQVFGPDSSGPWLDPTPDADPRALVDPSNASAPRRIGQWSAPPPPASGWQPSFPVDIIVADVRGTNVTYQFAVYFADYDLRGRRESVQLMDRATLNDISPTQWLTNFEGGVWLVWQYAASVRVRVNFARGTNQVVSAILFDEVSTA
jgi:hypothetical protein